jgi:hypothetical protein
MLLNEGALRRDDTDATAWNIGDANIARRIDR